MLTKPEGCRKPTMLIILDGFGLNPSTENNAVVEANTPNFDRYFKTYPMTELEASGKGVGLPEGQMGNSEVGHMTIGSGSIVKQDLVRIDEAIADGSFFDNPALVAAVKGAKGKGRPLHLIGLVSDGGVHSHISHLNALIDLCAEYGVVPQLHMITDGRDTAPREAISYLADLEHRLAKAGGFIGSICGRFFVMDRDKRWDRVQLAWEALVRASAATIESAQLAIQQSYDAKVSDEFIKPVILPQFSPIQGDDELVFFNFRNDRSRQISAALVSDDFTGFDRGDDFKPVKLTCLTLYHESLRAAVAFQPMRPELTLGSVISDAGFKQFHCAETEKYAHVTFFFNGGREECFAGEERSLVDSPRVATYDLMPEMSAPEVAERMIDALRSRHYQFLVVNFANGDMVGHTAVRDAVIKAVEVLDFEVGRLLDAGVELGYSIILTADHGNCDEMVDPKTGEPQTQHSQFPVPCMVVDADTHTLTQGGNLSAIAPTVLQLMGIDKPQSMSGTSLIVDDWLN